MQSPETSAEIRRLLLAGRKVDAIRVLRHKTGGDLKTAFDAVEGMIAADPALADLFASRRATQRVKLTWLGAFAIALVLLAAWIVLRPR